MNTKRAAVAAALLAFASFTYAQTAAKKVYIVELADAPAAAYTGGISGLAATRAPAGAKFDANGPSALAYRGYLASRQNAAAAAIGNVPTLHRYSVAFNGFSASLTEAQARAMATTPGVKSVVPSELRKLDTISTPKFLGLSTPGGLWSMVDASSKPVKGEDVVIGMIDSGVWPEDTAFGDRVDGNGKPLSYNQSGGTLAYSPLAGWSGVCQTGQGFTASMCNNKVIGARYYVTGFDGGGGTLTSFEYRSPRSGGGDGGHGTHTASTAGGNSNVPTSIDGTVVNGTMSGIAPRARLSIYKVCWEATNTQLSGCYTADSLKAIDDAVADGVDVINFSVSGTETNFADPVETAFLNAAAAGVFVAASAGNSGPGNEVAHISPWLMTVAASTHDRQLIAQLTLGNGSKYTGASATGTGVGSSPMVLSSTIAAPGVATSDANLCFLNSLDPAKATGKIVVCDRGTNARVEKSQEVKRVGGVGMVLINPTPNNLVADYHSVPTVHLPDTVRTAVRTYAGAAGATGSIGVSYQNPDAIAPVMADFSSRGPNKANGDILKPDITGPGVDVIAAWTDTSLTQAQHDALVLNNYTPKANAASLQGTSMSSPHVAGAAALLKQLHPTWSPAAIKSALMTTTNGVKLSDGTPDLDRWGYGAGHMNPTGAADPGLVYDITAADYGRFLCGQNLVPPASIGNCNTLGSIAASNLNLASITAANVTATETLTRKVTNVSKSSATYVATASLQNWDVVVTPSTLTLAAGASATFTVKLTAKAGAVGTTSFGSLVWSDNVHTVRSPLTASAVGFSSPVEVSDVRASGKGTKSYGIVSAYTGALKVSPTGLVPATVTSSTVQPAGKQCFDFTVPSAAQFARFQLFNADTQGGSSTDLDLTVYAGAGGVGTVAGSSAGSTSDEVVTLQKPAAGTYSACVAAFAVPAGGATYKLSTWIVGEPVGTQTLKAAGPSSVYAGGAATIGLGWNVPAGKRYMGTVRYYNGSELLGSTLVSVDNH